MRATHLQTEYLTEPMGLDITHPRFYWNCQGGVAQSAYQIIAKRGGKTLWSTGKVSSSAMTHIRYEGEPLRSRDRIEWSVTLWDENDIPGEESTSWFEMGLLEPSDWQAKWIAGDYAPNKKDRYPADCFKKAFTTHGEVVNARLYITACGVYEAKLNGARVGDFVLAPGCTDYRKRLQYQVYDVAGLLSGETNNLEIWLGDGWFRGSLGAYGQIHVYGRQTSLRAQLELTYSNGQRETVSTDSSFAWSNDGPIRFNDLKDGEVYDARMAPSYSGKARVVNESRTLTSSNNVFVREMESFIPSLITTPSGKKVLDFGQNVAGFLDFHIQGQAGQTVTLTCGEILDEQGELTLQNIQLTKLDGEFGQVKQILHILGLSGKVPGKKMLTPKQEVRFTCSGGVDHYRTRFAIFGFRYVQVDTEVSIAPANFKAVAVYSDLEQTGSFDCSNEKINRLYGNILWSMKGNFLDIPTDCPTRERLGWTGDAQVFFDTGAYLMSTAPFFRKWMQDMEDGKLAAGYVPAVVPHAGMDMMYTQTGGSVGWGCAAILLPYRFWKRYGDMDTLRRFYPLARSYAEYMIANTGHCDKKEAQTDPMNKYIYEKGRHLGEWLEPEEFNDKISPGSQLRQTEVATAYFHYDMTRMAEIAAVLGESTDAERYEDYAQGSGKAYRRLFLAEGAPDTDRQAKLVRPLALGLVEDDAKLKKALADRLVLAVEHRRYRIGTGFLSTPFILPVLTEAGRADLAYKMLENEQAPGWLHEVNAGATTIWESWEGGKGAGDGSHNHYSPGAVCQWMFETVCGIRPDGENHFIIQPIPGGSLTYAGAAYRSLYGRVESRWDWTGDTVVLSISIPANTTADIILPDGTAQRYTAGTHKFTWKQAQA